MLGRGPDDLHSASDANIYNDQDFYQLLLGDFLTANEEQNSDDDNEGS